MSDRFSKIDGAEIELVKGGGGVFEISRDGDLLFSKKARGRFPEEAEVESMAAQA